ncbi:MULTISPECIES: translation initiation factor IF-2 [Geobacter]|uniref:Translation initiation factor IF-2 n=2 Tax=Geobacter TaxID=28231 RepID=A0A0C1U3T1_9BACT|nr:MULTISPECIES: translation initiation factor IF-2 [Geobacter]ANA40417.1 translation initiation factor IF-2 [Geobacter anodireducens]KIE42430.1 translation initiation factor IF-2 [Geobacter soli]MBE2887148.1 translation initiation factor IF-2 [Geobacter anodireducens]HMN01277.1 translation initiation factor IF-2 [Geobacter anodireducens]
MSKTHVYELAKKMGIENKELLARLKSLGIEVKNHLSVLEEEDVRKVTAPPAAPPKSGPQEEVRVTTTVIRRRRVAEVAPVEPPVEAAVPPAESAAAPVEIEGATGAADQAPSVVEPSVGQEPVAAPAQEQVTSVAESAPEPPVVQKAPVAPVAPPVDDRPTPNRARILGRVELPGITTPAPRSADRREATAPRKRIEERIMTPSPAERPASAGDDRRRAGTPPPPPRKGKEFVAPAEPDRGAKKPGGGGAGKKKEAFKKAELLEKRERIFEPGPKTGKGKRRERDMVSLGRKTEITVPKAIKRIIKISESITVGELAKRMGIKATDLIRLLMKMGMMVTINHPLDVDAATLVAAEFGYEIENVAIDVDEMLESVPDAPENLRKRPPVVTIMGHVDHGKTSLLDAIREANVIAGEAGGITQHIGAYDVELNGRKITFLDTPGHEAFTAMRARGAKVTDIVILVVAADDGVMPQTREAVNHSKAAGVPIIVAINKIDKPEAKPERVKQELMEFGLVSEEWGGETIFVEVSAKKRINLPELLEMVLLQADVMDLKANPGKDARGTIVEAKLDRGRGPVATVLVQEGTLKVGDYFVAGVHSGRVRAMQNDRGEKVAEAGPSMPVEVIGFTGVPDAGDVFISLTDEKRAKEIASHRQQKFRETELAKHSKMSLEQLYDKIQKGEVKDLNAIVKADVQGSVEAVSESLRKLSTDAVRLNVIHSSVGAITETDVNLASASNAIILGFNVRPEPKASVLAEKEGVDIRLYNIIYDAVEDIKKAMEGLLEPTLREKYLGRAEVREVFSVPKIGNVAGCYVQDGKMIRNAQVRLLRDNVVIYEGKMSSLRRFKDDVKEVATGYECGIGLENYNDIKIGDVIEDFEIEKIATTL